LFKSNELSFILRGFLENGTGLAQYMDEDSNWHCLLQQFGSPRSKLWRAKAKAKKHFLSGSPFWGATVLSL